MTNYKDALGATYVNNAVVVYLRNGEADTYFADDAEEAQWASNEIKDAIVVRSESLFYNAFLDLRAGEKTAAKYAS